MKQGSMKEQNERVAHESDRVSRQAASRLRVCDLRVRTAHGHVAKQVYREDNIYTPPTRREEQPTTPNLAAQQGRTTSETFLPALPDTLPTWNQREIGAAKFRTEH